MGGVHDAAASAKGPVISCLMRCTWGADNLEIGNLARPLRSALSLRRATQNLSHLNMCPPAASLH